MTGWGKECILQPELGGHFLYGEFPSLILRDWRTFLWGHPSMKAAVWSSSWIHSRGIGVIVPEKSSFSPSAFASSYAYWTTQEGGRTVLYQQDLRAINQTIPTRRLDQSFTNIQLQTMTLDPTNGQLWVSDAATGNILSCNATTWNCSVKVNATVLMSGTNYSNVGMLLCLHACIGLTITPLKVFRPPVLH